MPPSLPDAGLLPIRELDDALGLTPIASDYLQESRTGRHIRHHLVPLLRQSIYSRLAGYDDTNDAERLSQDPAMRVVVGWQGSDRNAARTNTMSRFETGDSDSRGQPKGAGPDESPVGGAGHGSHSTPASDSGHGQFGESSAWSAGRSRLQRATSSVSAIIPSFCSTSLGIAKERRYDPETVHSADGWQELLEPVVKGYQKKGLRLLFRGDAAFAKPELIRVSGTRKDRVRHPASRQSGNSGADPTLAGASYRMAVPGAYRLLP